MLTALLPPAIFKYLKRPIWLLHHKLTGRRMQAHVHYRDFAMYGGFFEAPAQKVQQRLPAGFEVVEHRPGYTELEIAGLDYRKIDLLSPYRELGVMVPVVYRDADPPLTGIFVLQLPVTSEEARWTGVENYGFPKITADITITAANGGEICTVYHAGQHVLTLRVDALPAAAAKRPLRHLTIRDDGKVIASNFDIDGEIGELKSPGGVHLELGYHAIADQLRELGVITTSGRALYIPRAHAVLGLAEEVGRVKLGAAEPARTAVRPGDELFA